MSVCPCVRVSVCVCASPQTWAIKRMDRPEMERVLAECQRVNLHIPDVAHIIMALRLPPDEFLQRQLGAAVALRDADRVTDITMQIKVRAVDVTVGSREHTSLTACTSPHRACSSRTVPTCSNCTSSRT